MILLLNFSQTLTFVRNPSQLNQLLVSSIPGNISNPVDLEFQASNQVSVTTIRHSTTNMNYFIVVFVIFTVINGILTVTFNLGKIFNSFLAKRAG